MKKTIYMLPVLALLMFAACSSEDAAIKDNAKEAQLTETPENAIGFDAYLNRTVTRAGMPEILTTSTSDDDHISLQDANIGFGVFGYYADGDLYSENALPNFMYNQWVKYESNKWTYNPVKYWPNEFGTSAVSTGVDRVTFFAYAPYVEVTPNTGQLTSQYNDAVGSPETSTTVGITSLTRNGKTGDPYVRYVGAFNPEECVDLCYGVAGEHFVSSAGEGDGANDIAEGQPYLNVAKPAIGSRVNFLFKHALAQLTVNVDADVDIVGHSEGDNYTDNMTRVWIRSVTFNGIASKGYFNLHSGYWYDAIDNEKISRASVTIYDKRRDGSEATAEDGYESPTGLNANLVQSEVYGATIPNGSIQYGPLGISADKGVTARNQSLFTGTGTILVIPANEQMKVTIVYDVETADATLPTYLSDGKTKGSTVENKITKEITIGGDPLKLESGKSYTLNLHLGMTGVKFNATVSGWSDLANAGDVDLPANAPSASATAALGDPDAQTLTIPAATTTGVFAVSGLAESTGTGTCEISPTGWLTSDPTGTTVNISADGNLNVTFTATENKTVKQREATLTVKDAPSAGQKTAKLTVTQQAAALGLRITTPVKAGLTEIGLDAAAEMAETDWSGATYTVVKKSGGSTTTLTSPTNYSAAGVAPGSGSDYTGKITLTNPAVAGDVYTITVQSGNADPETVSFTVAKQASTIAFNTPAPGDPAAFTSGNYDANDVILTNAAVLTPTGSGSVAYTVDDTTNFDVTSDGVLIFKRTWSAGESHEVTVTATVTPDANHSFETTSVTYKITVSAAS